MNKPAQHKKSKPRASAPLSASAFEQAWSDPRAQKGPPSPPPTVSGRWLLGAVAIAIPAAALCAWAVLCLLFWQGSWQLLYHPASAVTRTPASVGLAFDSVGFAATQTGEPLLRGWWISAAPGSRYASYTVLYLHGQDGNIGDTVDSLAVLHGIGVNVLAFDYRGYGQSRFARPSEVRWREDAESALKYLTGTRHIPANTIVLDGDALGANLALQTAADHHELAGVILHDPIPDAINVVLSDPRARLIPARLLVQDRYELDKPATALQIPSLWLLQIASPPNLYMVSQSWVFKEVSARKKLLWLPARTLAPKEELDALSSLLDDQPTSTR